MSQTFDPYHQWLGIPPDKQPPNHYSLLAIEPFEDNPDVIENAADQRMAHLRTFQTGRHAELSQKLLNEVAAAKVCLLKPQKKAAYDEQLRGQLQREAAPAVSPLDSEPVDPALAGLFEKAGREEPTTRAKAAAGKRRPNLGPLLGIGTAGLLVIAILVWWNGRWDETATVDPRQAESEQPEAPRPPPPPLPPVRDASEPEKKQPAKNPRKETKTPTEPSKPTQHVVQPGPEQEQEGPGPKPPQAGADAPATKPDPQPPVSEPPKRAPVPSNAEQKKIVEQLKEIYNLDKDVESVEKLKLAKQLSDLANKAADPKEQFVLFRTAMELARDGGNATMMLETVDAIGARFEVDALSVKEKVLMQFAARATDSERIEAFVKGSAGLIEVAQAEARFDLAASLAERAYRLCQRPAGRKFRKQTYDWRREVQRAAQAWRQFQEVLARLKTEPDDPEANLAAGRWYCFTRGDWQRGLVHLAKGSDKPLKDLANQELTAPPTEAADQIKLADAWWDLAQSAKGEQKDAILLRAGFWYEQAQPDVTSTLLQTKVRKRLEEIAKLGRPIPEAPTDQPEPGASLARGRWVELLRSVDVGRDRVEGQWKRDDKILAVAPGQWSRLMLPVNLKGSYDLQVDLVRHSGENTLKIFLPVGSTACSLTLSGWQGSASGLGMIDDRFADNNPTTVRPGKLINGRTYRVLAKVRLADENVSISVAVNGTPYIKWTGKQSSLSLPGAWALPQPDRPGLGATDCAVAFHSVRLRLVSGEARLVGRGEKRQSLLVTLQNSSFEAPKAETHPRFSSRWGAIFDTPIPGWHESAFDGKEGPNSAVCISPYPRPPTQPTRGPGATDGDQVATLNLSEDDPNRGTVTDTWIFQSIGKVSAGDVGKVLELKADVAACHPGPSDDAAATVAFATGVTTKSPGKVVGQPGIDPELSNDEGAHTLTATLTVDRALVDQEIFVRLSVSDPKPHGWPNMYHYDNVRLRAADR